MSSLKYPAKLLIIQVVKTKLNASSPNSNTSEEQLAIIPTALILNEIGRQIDYLNENNLNTWGQNVPADLPKIYRFKTYLHYSSNSYGIVDNGVGYIDFRFRYFSWVSSLTQPKYLAGVIIEFRASSAIGDQHKVYVNCAIK